jgi:halogenation protein CepH
MRDFIARCPVISNLLEPATRVTTGEYGKFRVRSDYSYCNSRFFAPGLVLIGDSACFVDPVFSTGVHLATYSALLAARSINACLEGDTDEARAFEEFEHRYRLEFQNIYEFLLVIYDMNLDKDSYFWNARKIINTEEADNEAFVRLVAGLSTSDDFFTRRRNAGEAFDTSLKRHFYAESAQAAAPAGPLDPELVSVFGEHKKRRKIVSDEYGAMISPGEFSRQPIRPNGLVASRDGLSWRDPQPVA